MVDGAAWKAKLGGDGGDGSDGGDGGGGGGGGGGGDVVAARKSFARFVA